MRKRLGIVAGMENTMTTEKASKIIAAYYAKNPKALADRKARADRMAIAYASSQEARRNARREAGCLSGI